MRYVLPALIVCIVCAASRGTTESLLAGMLDPAFREWVHRPGEMYGFWLWRGPGSLGDPVARVGANATSIHLMMHLEETADGARVVTRPIDDPALDELAGVGVGLGEHNNPFFVRYPEWFWKLRQEARMKDAAGKTIRAGENPVPSMLDPLLVSLAKEQMAQMVGLLDEKAWVRYWVIGGEQSWPDYFGLPAGDYSPSVRRHFTAWKRLHNTPPPSKGGGGGRVEDWRDFRDSVVVDRYAGYTAWLHALDQTRPAMVPTHGNPFTMDFRQRLGYPIGHLAGVADGFEAGPISIDDDAERIIRMTLDQQTSFGIPVVAPRLANKQLDPAARGGGRSFNPATLRRTVYEALGLGVGHIGIVHWTGNLPDGEWGIADTPAEPEAKRIFEELGKAGPWLDGCTRLQPHVGIFISDAQWRHGWQDRWTLLYDEAIKRGCSVVLLTDVQIDAHLASVTPVLLTVAGVDVSKETQARVDTYRRAGGRLISVSDAGGPAIRVIHQTQTTNGANTWAFDVKPLDLNAVEKAAGADLRQVTVLENGVRAEGIEPLLITDGTNVQAVLINRTDRPRIVRLVPSSDLFGVRGPTDCLLRDLLTGELLSGDISLEPYGTALVSLEPPVTVAVATTEVESAESAIAHWTKLEVDTRGFQAVVDRAREHLGANRTSKAYALARSITQSLGLRVLVSGSSGLGIEARVWDARGKPSAGALVRFRLVPGRFEWLGLEERSPGVYRASVEKGDLGVFYNPSSERYELPVGTTQVILDAVSDGCRGGLREATVLK